MNKIKKVTKDDANFLIRVLKEAIRRYGSYGKKINEALTSRSQEPPFIENRRTIMGEMKVILFPKTRFTKPYAGTTLIARCLGTDHAHSTVGYHYKVHMGYLKTYKEYKRQHLKIRTFARVFFSLYRDRKIN